MLVQKLYVLLDSLVKLNEIWLANNYPPNLYDSGVRYRKEWGRRENWQDIPTTLKKGYGDCEDLAAWRVAELRFNEGENAFIQLEEHPVRNGVFYHVTVLRADGSTEDPSRALGME